MLAGTERAAARRSSQNLRSPLNWSRAVIAMHADLNSTASW